MILIWRLRRLKHRWHGDVFLWDILAANRKRLARFEGKGGSRNGVTLHGPGCSATVSPFPLQTHFTLQKSLERLLTLTSSCTGSTPSFWWPGASSIVGTEGYVSFRRI